MGTLMVSAIATDSNKNFSRVGGFADWIGNKDKFREIVASLTLSGWHENEPINILPLEEEYDLLAEVEKVKTFLTDWEVMPFRLPTEQFKLDDAGQEVRVFETYEVSNSDLLKAYDEIIKGGKPKYRRLDGYRRSLAVIVANALRVKRGDDPIREIPVVKHGALDINEQIILCVQENTNKGVGVQKLGWLDDISIAVTAYNKGAFIGSTEIILRRVFGDNYFTSRTKLQKMASIIDLINLFPNAQLFRVLCENPASAGKLDKEVLRFFYKCPRNKEESVNWFPADVSTVVRYFKNPVEFIDSEGEELGFAPTTAKAASGQALKQGAAQCKVIAIRELLEGCSVDNFAEIINRLNQNATLINYALEIIEKGNSSHPVIVALNEYAEEQYQKLMS